MVMNLKLITLIMLFSFCLMSAQEIIEVESLDSLDLELSEPTDSQFSETIESSDSLEVIIETDSLTESSQDTLQFFDTAMMDSLLYTQTDQVDSLDIVDLHNKLQEFLADKKQMRNDFQLPFIIEKEDFHWKTPFNPNLHFSKNGFTHFPFLISNIHVIQNFAPLFNSAYD